MSWGLRRGLIQEGVINVSLLLYLKAQIQLEMTVPKVRIPLVERAMMRGEIGKTVRVPVKPLLLEGVIISNITKPYLSEASLRAELV